MMWGRSLGKFSKQKRDNITFASINYMHIDISVLCPYFVVQRNWRKWARANGQGPTNKNSRQAGDLALGYWKHSAFLGIRALSKFTALLCLRLQKPYWVKARELSINILFLSRWFPRIIMKNDSEILKEWAPSKEIAFEMMLGDIYTLLTTWKNSLCPWAITLLLSWNHQPTK